MEIKFNIEKKYFWLLIIFIVVVGFVVAQANKPNPGHDASEISDLEGVKVNIAKNAEKLGGKTLEEIKGEISSAEIGGKVIGGGLQYKAEKSGVWFTLCETPWGEGNCVKKTSVKTELECKKGKKQLIGSNIYLCITE